LDWRKAIYILIISFVLLNISLGLNLWNKEKPEAVLELTQNQRQEIADLLKQKGITLEANIPEQGEPQAFLEIGYKSVDKSKTVEAFLGKEVNIQKHEIEGGTSYIVDDKQLIVMENGIITFFDKGGKVAISDLTEEEAQILAEEFLRNHTGLPENAILNSITYDEKSKGFLIEYIKTHDGFLIANSYMDILVTPTGIKSFYQCWLNPYGYKGKKRTVISPLTAVMRVADERLKAPMTITRIQQGYYSKFYDAERWQAAPVWTVYTKDGNIYYVNSYTGELEQ
jgi:regulatory protein YycI of two-component signal transduction system YycFG